MGTTATGLPVSMPLAVRRFAFTPVMDPRWRLVAKELIFAMLTPRHEAVTLLLRAYRTPMHVRTAHKRLGETAQLLNWLISQGIASLSEIGTHHCEAYLFTAAMCMTSTEPWSASAARAFAAPPPRPSSTCSTTVSCWPLTGPPGPSAPGGPPPPRSQRCPAAGP
jgi:hypothetical protein